MKCLLLVVCLFAAALAYESPTQDVKATDMIDKQLPAMDKKIWQNVLQFYANVRMVAKATLSDMQAVANFAWSAQRQLQSIENASKRIDQIYTAIVNYRGDNPVDFVMFAELKVFRQIDALKDYDVPTMADCNKNMKQDRDVIMNLGASQAQSIANVSVKNWGWFQDKFDYTQRIAEPDPRTVNQACPRPTQMAATMNGAVASEGLAAADIRNQNLQNQNAMLTAMVGATGGNTGGDVPERMSAQIVKDNNRNNVLLTLQENDLQNSAVTNGAWYLIMKARMLDEQIVSKALLVTCATAVVDQINSIDQRNARFVNRKNP